MRVLSFPFTSPIIQVCRGIGLDRCNPENSCCELRSFPETPPIVPLQATKIENGKNIQQRNLNEVSSCMIIKIKSIARILGLVIDTKRLKNPPKNPAQEVYLRPIEHFSPGAKPLPDRFDELARPKFYARKEIGMSKKAKEALKKVGL